MQSSDSLAPKGDRDGTMTRIRIVAGGYEARCAHCGAWREVKPRQLACDTFFSHYQVEFTCCGVQQSAQLTMEKDELDFH